MKNFILRTITCAATVTAIIFACSGESFTLPLVVAGVLSLAWLALFAYANSERLNDY